MRNILSCLIALFVAAPAVLAEPLPTFEGDGLTVRVTAMSEDETSARGELVFEGNTYPFTGQLHERDGTEYVNGRFTAGGGSYDFAAQRKVGDTRLTFTTGGKQYELRQQGAAHPTGGEAGGHVGKTLSTLERVTFTSAEFRDINMGNVVAYDMLIPGGFRTEGHIEWSQDKTPYPQKKIKVIGPDGSKITFTPAMTFLYWEFNPQAAQNMAALGQPTRSGNPPPNDLGVWLLDMIRQTNQKVSNLRLLSDQRDTAAENAYRELSRQMGSQHAGETEVHIIKYTYDEDGVNMTEEANLTYSKLPPSVTQNMTNWMWMLFTNSIVRAPTDKWTAMRPVLYASANSLRTVPKWFTQSQLLLMEITRNNYKIGMKEIADRAAFYDKMRDEDMKAWRKNNEISDKKQDERINMIYEVSNFAGPDGTTRKLPNGFKHYYSDGKGGFQMSNSNEPPKEGNWTPVEPMQ